MKSVLFAIGVAIAAFAAALAAGSLSWLFWDGWKATDLESFRALVGGFAGAFFAYLFVRFGDALKKIYDRKESNHTALVKLQHYFNDCLNTTGDNIFIVDDCASTLTDERLASAAIPIYMNSFHQYEINRDVIVKLTNVDFLNEVYSLNVTLRKINDTLATIDRSYSQLRDSLLSKNIDLTTYKVNTRQYRDRCIEIKGFLLQLKDDLTKLFASTNLLLKDQPFLVRVILATVRTTYPRDFESNLKTEQARVSAEMESIAQASREKISRAQTLKG